MEISKRYLNGVDLSHHNNNFYKTMDCWDFVIHKLSEGTDYVDPTVKSWWHTRPKESLNGVYHYMTSGDIRKQAAHVSEHLEKLNMAEHVMLIVDYEDASLRPTTSFGVEYLKQFISAIRSMYWGWQPVVYCNKSTRDAIIKYAKDDYNKWCLWLADYRLAAEDNKWCPVMRQWTNVPFDLDMFYGSPDSWREFYNLF